jgi:homoserine dehydrogenase
VSKSKINVGLLGMGTVGRGVYRILKDNRAGIEQKVGAPVDIKKILVRDPDKDRAVLPQPNYTISRSNVKPGRNNELHWLR